MTLAFIDRSIDGWLDMVSENDTHAAHLTNYGDDPIFRVAHLRVAGNESMMAQQTIAAMRSMFPDRTWYRHGKFEIRVVVSCAKDRAACLETRGIHD